MKNNTRFRKPVFTRICIFLFSILSLQSLLANSKTYDLTARNLTLSGNAEIRDDYVILFGRGKVNYTWISFPVSAIPFEKFSVEIEVAALPAAEKWPRIGLALADSNRFGGRERNVNSATWHWVDFGEIELEETDDEIFFVFTNDYFNPRTGEDLNLKIRDIRFRNAAIDREAQVVSGGRINVNWNANPEPDIAGYELHYGMAPGQYTTIVNAGLNTSYTLDVPVGFTYYLAVTAYDSSNQKSVYSQEIVFYTEPPHFAYDVNGDGEADLRDIIAVYRSLDSKIGDAHYSARADLNDDETVDEADLELTNANISAAHVPADTTQAVPRNATPAGAEPIIYAGDEFEIQLHVNADQQHYGAVTELHFPKDAIEILQHPDEERLHLTRGGFLENNLPLLASQTHDASGASSKLTIAWSLVGDVKEESGDGQLLSIRVRALKPGSHLIFWGAASEMISFADNSIENNFQNMVLNIRPAKPCNSVFVKIAKDDEM